MQENVLVGKAMTIEGFEVESTLELRILESWLYTTGADAWVRGWIKT